MKLKLSLLAATASIAIAPAASAYEGIYGSIGAGLSYFGYENDVSNDEVDNPGPVLFDSDSDYDNGVGIYTSIGYAWGNNFRSELEYSYRTADIDQIDPQAGFSGLPSGSISGDTRVHAIMVNTLYDFEGVSSLVTPYIGAGVGLASVNHDITGSTPGFSIDYADREFDLALQGIAGVAVNLTENLFLDLSYRYFRTSGATFEDSVVNGVPSEIEARSDSHNAFVGLRWNFGASAPVAPPVQYKDCWDGSSVPISAECPPQIIEEQAATLDPIQFTVYFDYDKSNLTPQAATLVQEASSRALQNDVDTVVVSGNTDTSGSSAYNQALSERRARVVREALIANGISADRIRSEAYGESNLAKATPDGVREPLNRRSEVVISFE
ncbi:MAG: OmpA family protein [Pseudomonadota bacterium]